MAYVFFEHLGRVVREHREAIGQTMREASVVIGISLTYFCQIEHGERIPTKQKTLTALFKWMGKRYRGLSFEVTP